MDFIKALLKAIVVVAVWLGIGMLIVIGINEVPIITIALIFVITIIILAFMFYE